MTKRKVTKDDLRGLKSPAGFNVLYKLLIGSYTATPLLREQIKTLNEHIEAFEALDKEQKSQHIREALKYCELEQNEILVLLSFCKDANGVEFSKSNINNLTHLEILNLCAEVLEAYADCTLFF